MPTLTAFEALQYVKDPTVLEYGDTAAFVRMAQEHPVVHVGSMWFLFANEAARWALSCPGLVVPTVAADTHSQDTRSPCDAWLLAQTLMPVQHPDDHRRLRRGITPLLAARRLDELTPELRTIAGDVVDGLLEGRRVDLVRHAGQLAGRATAAALGVPPAQRRLVLRWADAVNRDITRTFTAATPQGSEPSGAGAAPLTRAESDEVELIVEESVARLLTGASPACPHARPDVSSEEAAALARMTFMGGLDTVVAAACGAVHLLDRHRDVLAALRSGVITGREVVAEAVRCLPPFPFVGRVAGASAGLKHGIAPGESVVVVLGAANHDPRVFEDPEVFRPGRDQRVSLAFGRGWHHCIGEGLAERVTAAFLEQFAARVRDVTVERPLHPRRSHAAGGPEQMVVQVS